MLLQFSPIQPINAVKFFSIFASVKCVINLTYYYIGPGDVTRPHLIRI